jgi:hypothetical protein
VICETKFKFAEIMHFLLLNLFVITSLSCQLNTTPILHKNVTLLPYTVLYFDLGEFDSTQIDDCFYAIVDRSLCEDGNNFDGMTTGECKYRIIDTKYIKLNSTPLSEDECPINYDIKFYICMPPQNNGSSHIIFLSGIVIFVIIVIFSIFYGLYKCTKINNDDKHNVYDIL